MVNPRNLATGRPLTLAALVVVGACQAPAQTPPSEERGARVQPGTEMGLYIPEQHALYDGRFIVTGTRVYQSGTLSDPSPWDHMGDDASNLRSVGGRVDFDVNEIENTGSFRAELELALTISRIPISSSIMRILPLPSNTFSSSTFSSLTTATSLDNAGRYILNFVPFPASDSTEIIPSCFFMIE